MRFCWARHNTITVLLLLAVGLASSWRVWESDLAAAPQARDAREKAQKRRNDGKRLPPPKVVSQLEIKSPPLPAEEEQKRFHLPEEFEIELVLEESEEIGKFVAVAFDAAGRLWTMTALEYPVDANDDPEASRRLFERGGRDKVLVMDDPYGSPGKVRVFADGLAIPLGMLPYRDGAFVQYGPDIRFYRDRDGDGRADGYEVLLTGFGTQDSHLFPHQFTRVPGDWILLAQGLFNDSVVRRGDGRSFASGAKEVVFRHCKLARFRPDGSEFELLTAGPNNIWGLAVSREGEIWIQEANDLGYPIAPYFFGARYPTGSRDWLKPYQPLMPPPLAPPQMGGTGLSGLALADDFDGWPDPWGRKGAPENAPLKFYVANPVIGRIQMIEAIPIGNGLYRYRKLPDFLACDDPRFRPVALRFGPDGCLYVVDWYNKIISHNEVPRNHPERDRWRGRIWRIRHRNQQRVRPPDLTTLPDTALLDYLGAPNATLAHLAWQEIVDRQARDLVPALRNVAADANTRADRRLGALWALEGLEQIPTALLEQLVRDPNPNIRFEAVRIAAYQPRPERDFVGIAKEVLNDPSPRVRAALGEALLHVRLETVEGMKLLLEYVPEPTAATDPWQRYFTEYYRFLARWAMEKNSDRLIEFLDLPVARDLPIETRVLATLALPGREAAVQLAALLPQLDRPLGDEEIRVLASHIDEPGVSRVFEQLLTEGASQLRTLRALVRLQADVDLSGLRDPAAKAVAELWGKPQLSGNDRRMLLKAAAIFRVQDLEPDLLELASRREEDRAMRLEALQALRQIGVTRADKLLEILAEEDNKELRRAAIAALAGSVQGPVVDRLVDFLVQLSPQERTYAIEQLSATRTGATALVRAVERGTLTALDIPVGALEQMRILLPENDTVEELWTQVAHQVVYVLRLHGGPDDYVDTDITLDGPFTVETWVRLSPDITNADGILGAPGQLDMNFYDGRFRVWVRGHHDIVIAQRTVQPGSWTHVAVTRDETGRFRIFINGELDAVSERTETRKFTGLDVGRTIPIREGTSGELVEYRVWDRALAPEKVRELFDVTFGDGERPKGLKLYFHGKQWGPLRGLAAVEPIIDGPVLLPWAEALARRERFEYYRTLAAQKGDLERGRALFERTCLVCHTVANKGGEIGPPLDGIGLKGIDSILRNVLTPNAAVEGGYRLYRVLTTDGRIVQGLLVAQDDEAVVIRQPDQPDERIARNRIERAGYTSASVMPEGLLDSLTPEEARDLLNYVLTLK